MNEIKLYGAIGYPGITSATFKSLLADCDPSQELVIRIDSEGGSVFDGLGIHDAIAAWPGDVRAVVESSAFSIASFIAMAADSIDITENGYLMLHNPYTATEGDSEDLQKQAELLGKLRDSMVSAYAGKTGKSREEVEAVMRAETWLDAREAQASGFVDSILPTARRSVAVARFKGNMPERVIQSLNDSGDPSGATAIHKEIETVSSNPKAVATVKSIKARFGNANPEFIVAALAAEMTDEQVAESYYSEMVTENEQLKAKLAAMEQELQAMKTKAQEIPLQPEMPEKEDDEEETSVVVVPASKAKAKARPGVQPVAKPAAVVSLPKTAKAAWNDAIESFVAKGMTKAAAAVKVNREFPQLREKVLEEANPRS